MRTIRGVGKHTQMIPLVTEGHMGTREGAILGYMCKPRNLSLVNKNDSASAFQNAFCFLTGYKLA